MKIEIIVPRLGWSMEEGNFVAWLKKHGELVRAGDPIFSIEGDKAIQEIESIDGGILHIIEDGPAPGDKISVGDLIGYLVPAAADIRVKPSVASEAPTALEAPSSQGRVDPKPSTSGTPSSVRALAASSDAPTISPRAWRVAEELGVDWMKLKGSGSSGRIRERDVRAAQSATDREVLNRAR